MVTESVLGCCVIIGLKFSIKDVGIPTDTVVSGIFVTETSCSDCPEVNMLLSVTEEDVDDCVELINGVES